ncbi:uncharacterized protein LAJ45_03700 [Morchella importuna]|uniref:uncharacterized protein n=1 Tax=Morchella importuna TaxID=1174673 RepID=UPI001E8ED774|nr:uncharacterized protein LAJ45_03700 [Morchella importuna]KAH8152274.1 hypothetical protein LAJ45_03700 [Morchella importuna]
MLSHSPREETRRNARLNPKGHCKFSRGVILTISINPLSMKDFHGAASPLSTKTLAGQFRSTTATLAHIPTGCGHVSYPGSRCGRA